MTVAPSTGIPSRVTVPRTDTGESPHPARISRGSPSTPLRLRADMVRTPRKDPGDSRRGVGSSGDVDRLTVVAGAEVLVGAHVDALLEEADRTVGEAEVGPAGVVRLEPPGHVPVPDAVGRVHTHRRATAAAVAPRRPDFLAVDRVVDGLNRLPLTDRVVARPAPAIAEPLELHLLHKALAQEDGIGGAVGDVGEPDRWAANGAGSSAHHPPAVGGVTRGPVDRAGAVAGVSGRVEGERNPVRLLAADQAVAVDLERVGAGAARAVVALRAL